MNQLKSNQLNAINISIQNDFDSGIHFHATGTGKSWIAMNIIYEYNKKYPLSNIMWLCEKKSILIEQFNLDTLQDRNFESILNKFKIFNYAKNKNKNWIDVVNNYNDEEVNKPILLVINRAYLTSKKNYESLNIKIDLIIHDECHSIINKSTQLFYNFILEKLSNIKCIGFSATPYLDYKPFNKLLSSYSIYDAFIDKVIVPPKIKWISVESDNEYQDNSENTLLIIKKILKSSQLIYNKIIIWCGMINYCYDTAELWSTYFPDYAICIDTSSTLQENINNITYEEFSKLEEKGILFCANKHREGSDIKNLDCCIFLDNVKSRSAKLFIQSIGRVLRLDKNGNKNYGLIIDLKNKSSINVITKINKYLNPTSNIFPWHHSFNYITIKKSIKIKVNTLDMIEVQEKLEDEIIKNDEKSLNIDDLKKLFIRPIIDDSKYHLRLNEELELISHKNLINHLVRAIEILNITKNIPHVTRGSCGSSLICYLLGITHIDPIKYDIKFARFLNEYRNNLPDIDLDFPHKYRDEVFFQLESRWHNKIARISNKVHYHDKSALRQALRNAGIRKFISKYDLNKTIKQLPSHIKNFVLTEKKKLEETFKCYSLHCGGIVYYPEGIPKKLLLKSDKVKILNQIILDKYDIGNDKTFKIDILSSRALSQLFDIYKNFDNTNIDFSEYEYDEQTYELLGNGHNIGITLSESPLMRFAFMKIKPKSIYDIALCLSIIRPAAVSIDSFQNFSVNKGEQQLIFDDDAIEIIAKVLNVSDADADMYRRYFTKNDKKKINEFKKLLENTSLSIKEQKSLFLKLSKLSTYGFCKAHAFSYAQLIYKLAYCKVHYPKQFWEATLNNCKSSYYKWVHIHEASLHDVYPKNKGSIYALNRQKKLDNLSSKEQLQMFGYWTGKDFYPKCYLLSESNDNIENIDSNSDIEDIECASKNIKFNGIIASIKIKNTKNSKYAMILLGVASRKYIQLNIKDFKPSGNGSFKGIKGIGKYSQDETLEIIICNKYTTW